jgi:hypothetical protein
MESLSSEIIIHILSSAQSLEDLGALIRASPVFYRPLILAKTSILLDVGADRKSLGPAIRDAVILAEISLTPFVANEAYDGYDGRMVETVARYRQNLK